MFICCNSHHYRLSSRVEEPNSGLRELGGSLSGEAGCVTWVTGDYFRGRQQDDKLSAGSWKHTRAWHIEDILAFRGFNLLPSSTWHEQLKGGKTSFGSDFGGFQPLMAEQSQWEQEAAVPILLVSWEVDTRTYSSKDHTYCKDHCIRQVPPPKVSQFP